MLHRAATTPRYSVDLDLFHDLEDSVARSAEADAATLQAAGHEVSWLLRAPTFHRAVTRVHTGSLRIEWAQDSAFRFFPLFEDDRFGYRLHDTDAAVNKILALAGRSEIRDFVDVLHLDVTYLSLGGLVWAGCGKDPGFTPDFLLEQASRHAAYTQVDLDRLALREAARPRHPQTTLAGGGGTSAKARGGTSGHRDRLPVPRRRGTPGHSGSVVGWIPDAHSPLGLRARRLAHAVDPQPLTPILFT